MDATAESAGTVGRNHIIERPRLTRLLDDTSARVIMLIAPAGYGKTTLARQWLANREHAWYQAGAASSDIAALALGIAETANELCPGAGQRLREWLPTSREPEKEVDTIAELLAADLEMWPEDAWFVIDDHHELCSSEASNALTRHLFVDGGRRLFVTSRRRPGWWSARQLLYGEALEVGQTALAMTSEEATGVLADQAMAVSGLVALADGWPAVIGLAALTKTAIESADLSGTLYEYFAEEVFSALPHSLRSDVCRLALLPALERTGAQALLGASAAEAVAAAKQAGLLVAGSQPETFHPLLRAFLVHKLGELSSTEQSKAVRSAIAYLLAKESWDEAFGLISEFSCVDVFDDLVTHGMRNLLHESRLATLRDWILFAEEQGHDAPETDLLEAEVLYRRGIYDRAEILARSAASRFAVDHALRSAAYFRAGQCSYLMDDPQRALSYSRSARMSARTTSDVQNALWSEFNALAELEDDEALERLREFADIAPDDRNTIVRFASGRLVIAVRLGGLDEAVANAHPAQAIVSDVSDPTIRSSFWHAYAVALRLQGNYMNALAAASEAERVVRDSGTNFALPHVLINQAAALIGLRRFVEAEAMISEVERNARETRDQYALANVLMLRARRLLHEGNPHAAAALLDEPLDPQLSPSMAAEVLMTFAAALAGAGNFDRAIHLVSDYRRLSKYVEPALLARWVRALCSTKAAKPSREAAVRRSYLATQVEGAFDVFVLAYRIAPALLEVAAQDEAAHESLRQLVLRAQDHELLRSTALRANEVLGNRSASTLLLTPRESQVFGLLVEGKTNREIAATLVISELTVKVHVHHILKKLGVRTRTQAAVQGLRAQHRPSTLQ
jgi:LuxR family maltose regulon positive regulatory protein